MRAVWYERNGPASEVLEQGEMETPRPGHGEVRVRLRTSGINPSDVKTRAGTVRKIAFPRIVPHSDGAGEIESVGEGVERARVGERVWMWNAAWKRPFGTAAEYVVLPAAQAVRLPEGVGFGAGACLGIPAMTAWRAVTIDGAVAGQTILVAGGAGGVGHYAIQFAKAAGARVLTTVSSPAKAELARAAGADETIDYRREDVGARVKAATQGRGADRIIELDLAANAGLIPEVLRPGGKVIVYGTGAAEAKIPAGFCLQNAIGLQFFLVYELDAAARAAAIAGITTALEAGTLRHNIARTLPLESCVEGHEAVESGKVAGNVVLEIG
jgi:NADPH:quinone reductase-like Zn-dependent oxidoreductase